MKNIKIELDVTSPIWEHNDFGHYDFFTIEFLKFNYDGKGSAFVKTCQGLASMSKQDIKDRLNSPCFRTVNPDKPNRYLGVMDYDKYEATQLHPKVILNQASQIFSEDFFLEIQDMIKENKFEGIISLAEQDDMYYCLLEEGGWCLLLHYTDRVKLQDNDKL